MKQENIYSIGSTTRDGVQIALLEKRIFEITGGAWNDRKEISREEIEIPMERIWELVNQRSIQQIGLHGIHQLMVDQFNSK
jgi:hypothetical protein